MPLGGEDVLCHLCNNIYPRDESGLTCPRCGSDFTEIIEGSAEELPGIDYQDPPFSPRSPHSPQHDTRQSILDHNPWQHTEDHETQETDDIPGFSRHSYRSPDGNLTFTTTTWTRGMPGRRRSVGSPDQFAGTDPLLQTMGTFFQELAGAYAHRDRHVPNPDREDPWETPGATRGTYMGGGLFPRDTTRPQPATMPLTSLNDIFDLLQNEAGEDGLNRPHARVRVAGPNGANPMHILSLLAGMMGGGRMGDAVYSQEELDHVISQLVEQTGNQGAPPASETAIHSLPKKAVDKEMLGAEGKAECSICMEAVEVGSEVTELPCKHWFHGDCIEVWLKQHNTCPHCRRGINEGDDTPGTRDNPMVIPSSPPQSSQDFRNPYHRHQSFGSSPPRSSLSRHASSAPPEDDQDESQSQSPSHGGGVSGWIRSRFGSG
ncbi:hypothetical protein BGW36DRAFT_8614 [Talaromyces proteolyticus]|uniref:RING-type E3 ubiquitin transferase n=1 Tax=Talaromyces proteolyticus TaxID=1131652 RepID=A0AAD4Q614_9EURO|nr:uncharacterized protein BGW36DRAFT_8614 [Talaromyces proteolyticus]KAH8705163.1 hypothetical protein BGW36DRAFT_8614 [Talaromyces proteolyticus]